MAKKKELTPEEKLQQAIVPKEEQPYPLPEGWRWVRLESICEVIMGQSPNGVETTDDSSYIPLIGGAADMGELYLQPHQYTKKPTKISKADDLILCIRATLGRPNFADGEYCLGRGVAAIRSNLCSKEFLRYMFLNFEQYLYDNATGSTFLSIGSSALKSMPVPFPSQTEQIQIVEKINSYYQRLDEASKLIQHVLNLSEKRKAAILHKAFTGELTTQWRREHSVGMESWEKTILKNVCKVNPKKINTKGLSDNLEVSFFPMASLSETSGEITKPKTKLLKDVRTGFTNFLEGDVVFAKITPCMENGKSAIIGKLVNDIGYGTTEFYVLRCGEKLYNRYLYHIVRDIAFRNKAKSVMVGAVGQQRVPKSFMEDYLLNLPSVCEQKKIVQILDDFFVKEIQVKKAAEGVIEQIKLIQKGILGCAFRGELDNNNFSKACEEEPLK